MQKKRHIKKLLAANRSEIAIRIFRAANELSLRTVAIYSQEDRLSLHRFKADEAYQIGAGKGPVEAYLDIAGIVELAREKGVDAIHPGYGFLSENPALARACKKAGIIFVGPTPELLGLLGDKTAARKLAASAGVPVLPGTEEAVTSGEEAQRIARKIGFPVMIKAAMGGGGRGMRVVHEESQLEDRLEEARGEALASFGDAAVFLEKYVARARHLEVQILADNHGNVLHLWERDCSVQRRHQKVVEVAPAANLDPAIRTELCEYAVRIARKAGYRNAGTVEFLFDADSQKLYFIEVNPRIQVEHTVTEMVTGVDLVRSQILIAQGHTLHDPPLSLPAQEAVPLNGAALQCRVTTEDPENHFAPDYGKITTYRSPAGFGIRLDGGTAYSGATLAPFYDSLLVKVTAWDGFAAASLPPHGPRAARVPHTRREDEHSVPRKCGEPSAISGRARYDLVSRRVARALSPARTRGPGDEAALLSGRRDLERQPGSEGQARAEGFRAGAGSALAEDAAAGRHAPDAARAGRAQIRSVGAEAEAAADNRHDVSRCASVAAGDARPHT